MKRNVVKVAAGLAVLLTGGVSARTVWAAPVTLSITQPQTPVAAALAALSKQTGTPILADDTVTGALGTTTVDKPTLEEMLTYVQTLSPGLSWQRVFLPSNAPLPSGDVLSEQIRALKAIAATGLVAADPTAKSVIAFSRRETPDAEKTAPAGMQTVYLLTNETVRAGRLAAKKAADDKKKVAAGAPTLEKFSAGVQNIPTMFGQLSPDQQRQALGVMMQQAAAIWQNMDPGLRQQLQQMSRQRGQNGGGFPGTP